jgi:hypothetical protein
MNPAVAAFDSVILERLVDPQKPTLTADAARCILSLQFTQEDRRRMGELAEKARQGALSEEEQAQADSYERIGSLLAVLQSKARRSLQNQPS